MFERKTFLFSLSLCICAARQDQPASVFFQPDQVKQALFPEEVRLSPSLYVLSLLTESSQTEVAWIMERNV